MSVLLLGLDGTPWSILNKWMDGGHLPNMKKLYEMSAHGTLRTTIPTYTCPALPTLFSGKSQGKTGIFGFTYADGTPVSLRSMRDFKIWDILGKNDKESCIVNVRMLYPVEPLKGIMISGNPAPSEDSDYVYPSELKERIAGFRHEEINRLSEELTIDPQKNKEEILGYRLTMTKNRYKVFKELNSEKNYDFSFFWIGGTDFMGHWFWDDDETYLRYFKEVDLLIKDIIDTFGDRNILVISDHGMQGIQTKKFFVNTWLEKIGYLKSKGNVITKTVRKIVAPKISTLLSKENKERLRRFLNRGSSEELSQGDDADNKKGAFEKLEYGYIHSIDWDNTKAYLVNDWGIKVKIDPGDEEYDSVRNDIIKKMNDLVDEVGNKIVKDVWKKEEFMNGPYLDQVPDIIFILEEDYGMGIVPSRNIVGTINKDQVARGGGRFFRGDHEGAIEGILMAYGPDIKPGALNNDAKLMDIMPTILHILDVDVPDDVDGVVLGDIFKEDSPIFKREIKKRDYGKPDTDQESLSPEENEKIIESLKQMGYM